ncbi:hypothetical protein ACMC56_09875 [Campylobacterota bacterium DY0563]
MKIKKYVLFILIINFFFAGCAVTSGSLKKEEPKVNFNVNKNYKMIANQTYEMLELCDKFPHKREIKFFNTVETASITMTDEQGTFYYFVIDVKKIDDKKSNVKVYTYFNDEMRRIQSFIIKDWILNNSKECQDF